MYILNTLNLLVKTINELIENNKGMEMYYLHFYKMVEQHKLYLYHVYHRFHPVPLTIILCRYTIVITFMNTRDFIYIFTTDYLSSC